MCMYLVNRLSTHFKYKDISTECVLFNCFVVVIIARCL